MYGTMYTVTIAPVPPLLIFVTSFAGQVRKCARRVHSEGEAD